MVLEKDLSENLNSSQNLSPFTPHKNAEPEHAYPIT